MTPLKSLMVEHRVIERMIKLMEREILEVNEGDLANPAFVDTAADFFRNYAGSLHHGKEENILFSRLAEKHLVPKMRDTLNELIGEHVVAGELVERMDRAKDNYIEKGDMDSLKGMAGSMKALADFYPRHIQKEDKQFFDPAMGYLSKEEQDEVLAAFRKLDAEVNPEEYEEKVTRLEREMMMTSTSR